MLSEGIREPLFDYKKFQNFKKLPFPIILGLTSLGKGWTNVHPDFQNGSKKIISHRFRVIQV